MNERAAPKVVPLLPKEADLQLVIREIAYADQRVYFGAHARERMVERSITRQDAIRVLRSGHLDGDISFGKKPGELKCKITGKMKGSREIGVVTIVADGSSIFVKTVEWEDLR